MIALWRGHAEQNALRERGNHELTLTAPDPKEFQQFSIELVDRVYTAWQMAGFQGMPPNPFDMLAYPDDFWQVLLKFHQGVQFYEDWQKRPAWLRE